VSTSAPPRPRQAGRNASIAARSDFPPFTNRDEEIQLGIRIVAGDVEARNELCSRHLRLVKHWGRRYHSSLVERDDLEGAGFLGLIRAATLFDPDRGRRFSTYATIWIRSFMLRALRKARSDQLARIDYGAHCEMFAVDKMFAVDSDPAETETAHRICRAFHALPRLQRIAIGRAIGFVPAGEVAGQVPKAGRKQHKDALGRAMKRLRAALGVDN
jgi:RNA polymerase sigma factor (sigma-70 family)